MALVAVSGALPSSAWLDLRSTGASVRLWSGSEDTYAKRNVLSLAWSLTYARMMCGVLVDGESWWEAYWIPNPGTEPRLRMPETSFYCHQKPTMESSALLIRICLVRYPWFRAPCLIVWCVPLLFVFISCLGW